jgi:hypothetical protein
VVARRGRHNGEAGRKREFTFDGSAGVVVRDDNPFEVVDILDNLHDGFGTQPVPDGVTPRPMVAGHGSWTGASSGVAPVSLVCRLEVMGLVAASTSHPGQERALWQRSYV